MGTSAIGEMNIILSANAASFSAGIDQAQRQLDKLAGRSRETSKSMVSSMQASSAAIRVLEGGMTGNIRAAERFISIIPGLGSLLQAAFPVVGGIAFLGVLVKIGEETAKFIKQLHELPEHMQLAFGAAANSQRQANDELALTNDKLREQIAILEGKPVNNAALAIDETRIAADRLADSLAKSAERFQQLMSSNGLSRLQAIASAALLNSEQKSTAPAAADLQKRQNEIELLGFQRADAVARGDSGAADKIAEQIKKLQDAEIVFDRQRIAADQAQSAASRRFLLPLNPNNAPGLNTTLDQLVYHQDLGRITEDQRSQQEQADNAKLNARVDADKRAQEFSAKQKQIASEDLQQWREQLEELKSVQGMTLQQEAQFWLQRAALTKDGALARAAALAQANKVMATMQAENFRAGQEFDALQGGSTLDHPDDTAAQAKARESANAHYASTADLAKGDNQAIEQQSRQTIEFLENLNRGVAIEKESSGAFAEFSIRMAEATGQMSKLDAAQLRAQLHTEEYRDSVEQLAAAIDNAKTMPGLTPIERQAQVSGLQDQGAQMQSQRMQQMVEDQQAVVSQTIGGASKEALDEMVQSWKDMASQIADTLKQTVSGFNDDIVRLVTARHLYRGDISNAFGQTFRDAGGSLLRTGLQRAEASVLGHFGIGGEKKPTGAQGDPLYVLVGNFPGAGSASPLGQSVDQILGKIPGAGRVAPGQIVGDFFSSPASTTTPGASAVPSALSTALPSVAQFLSSTTPAAAINLSSPAESAGVAAPSSFDMLGMQAANVTNQILRNFGSTGGNGSGATSDDEGTPAAALPSPGFALPGAPTAPLPADMLSLGAPSTAVEHQDAAEQRAAEQPMTIVTRNQPSRWPNIIQSLTGTVFGKLLGGGFSGGGRISGPGSGTSDSINAKVSDGEFIVRASQTAKHLPLLHAINNGTRFATGGLVGGSTFLQETHKNVMRFADGGLFGGADVLSSYPSLTGDMDGFAATAPSVGAPSESQPSGDAHFHIDARGANDPAQTEAAIHRAMRQYLPQAAALAMRTTRDYDRRRPPTGR